MREIQVPVKQMPSIGKHQTFVKHGVHILCCSCLLYSFNVNHLGYSVPFNLYCVDVLNNLAINYFINRIGIEY